MTYKELAEKLLNGESFSQNYVNTSTEKHLLNIFNVRFQSAVHCYINTQHDCIPKALFRLILFLFKC